MKKATFLILLVNLNIFNSCFVDECGPFPEQKAKIINIVGDFGNYDGRSFNTVSSSREFSKSAIIIAIEEMQYFSLNLASNNSYSLLACDPAAPQPTQKIQTIEITSDKLIESNTINYEAGSDLSSLFKVIHWSSTMSVRSFIERQNADLFYFGHQGSSFILQLRDEPNQTIDQQIDIEMTFSDGEVFMINIPQFIVEVE